MFFRRKSGRLFYSAHRGRRIVWCDRQGRSDPQNRARPHQCHCKPPYQQSEELNINKPSEQNRQKKKHSEGVSFLLFWR